MMPYIAKTMNLTLCDKGMMIEQCVRDCADAAAFNSCLWGYMLLVAGIFYFMRYPVLWADFSPKQKTSICFGLLLAFKLLFVAGILMYLLQGGVP